MTAHKVISLLMMLFTCKSLDALTTDSHVLGVGATRSRAMEVAVQEYEKYQKISDTSRKSSYEAVRKDPATCRVMINGMYECVIKFNWKIKQSKSND